MVDNADFYRANSAAPPPIPAATLVIFRRNANGGPPQLLMVVRSKAMRFAGGAAVFPGGRIDDADHDLAAQLATSCALDANDLAARIGAIRETLEETGLALGLVNRVTADEAGKARAMLVDGASFADVLTQTGWKLAPETLVPFARWCPRHPEVRVFDTRFYLADTGTGAVDIAADETETRMLFWASAAETLARAEAGDLSVIFPTARNLERLAQFGSFAQARAHAEATPVQTISPYHELRDGEDHLCIPDGLGYPVTSQAMAAVKRG